MNYCICPSEVRQSLVDPSSAVGPLTSLHKYVNKELHVQRGRKCVSVVVGMSLELRLQVWKPADTKKQVDDM